MRSSIVATGPRGAMLADRDQTSVAQAGQSEAEAERVSGANIVEIARGWLGTPYRHQASLKGVGCDCLGLIRGVYAEAYGRPAETPPAYSRDWAEAAGHETMIEAADRHLIRIDPPAAEPGNVVIFRLRPGAMAKHSAILSDHLKMIHAVEGAPVCEVSLSSWWRRRIAAAYRFPNLETPDAQSVQHS